MKCYHCLIEIHPDFKSYPIGSANNQTEYYIEYMNCPSCGKFIIRLMTAPIFDPEGTFGVSDPYIVEIETYYQIIYPKESNRPMAPPEIDKNIADDYNEACLVLPLSRKASAALSRRCLQNILREKAGVTKGDLSKEIQQVIDGPTLPSHLKESIDAIRNIGNYAAHPIKSTSSGEIIDVEPGEAEWSLDVLESLFDFYYVQPAKIAAKRAALDAKLADAGKPPMK